MVKMKTHAEDPSATTPASAVKRVKKVRRKIIRSDLNLSRNRIIKALGLNTSAANRSLIARSTLRANNRALAQALENAKQENRMLNQALVEEKAERQNIMLKLTTLNRVAGLTNDGIEAEVQKRFDNRMFDNRKLLNTISSQLLGVVELLGEALETTSGRHSSLGSGRASAMGEPDELTEGISVSRRSIYNQPVRNVFDKGVPRLSGGQPGSEAVPGHFPVQLSGVAANLSLIAESVDHLDGMDTDQQPNLLTKVSEDEEADGARGRPGSVHEPGEPKRLLSLLPQRVPKKAGSSSDNATESVTEQQTDVGGQKTKATEAGEWSGQGKSSSISKPLGTGKQPGPSKEPSATVATCKATKPGLGAGKPSKRSKRKRSPETEESFDSTGHCESGEEIAMPGDGTEQKGIDRRGTFVLPIIQAERKEPRKSSVQPESEEELSSPTDKAEEKTAARRGTFVLPANPAESNEHSKGCKSSQPSRKEAFTLPSVLRAIRRPSEQTVDESEEVEKQADKRGEKRTSKRQTYSIPNPFKPASKCSDQTQDRADQQMKGYDMTETTAKERRKKMAAKRQDGSSADNPAENASSSVLAKTSGKARRGTFLLPARKTDAKESADGGLTSDTEEEIEKFFKGEGDSLLVERSFELPSNKDSGDPQLSVEPAQSAASDQYGANMMEEDDATVLMDMDMEFTEVINIPMILGGQSMTMSCVPVLQSAQQGSGSARPATKAQHEPKSYEPNKPATTTTRAVKEKERALPATEESEDDQGKGKGKGEPKDPATTSTCALPASKDSNNDQGKAKGEPMDPTTTRAIREMENALLATEESEDDQGKGKGNESAKSLVEVRVGKLGDVRYAVGRKDDNGVRQAVPEKLPAKTRSKQRKPKAPAKSSGKSNVLQTERTSTEPPSIFDYHDKTPQVTKEKTASSHKSVFDVSMNESCVGQKFTFQEFRKQLSRCSSASTDEDQLQAGKESKAKKPRSKSRSKAKKNDTMDNLVEESDSNPEEKRSKEKMAPKPRSNQRRASARLESLKSSDSEKENTDNVTAKDPKSQTTENKKQSDCRKSQAKEGSRQGILINSGTVSDDDSPVVKKARLKKRVTIAIMPDTDSEEEVGKEVEEATQVNPVIQETPVPASRRHLSRLSENISPPDHRGQEQQQKGGAENQCPETTDQVPASPTDKQACLDNHKRTSSELLALYNQLDQFGEDDENSRKRRRRGATNVCYKEPRLRSKLRQGDKYTSSVYGENELPTKKKAGRSRSKSSLAKRSSTRPLIDTQ